MSDHHEHDDHHHGHEHDRGLRAMVRYLGHARRMWRSEINEAVVARLAPGPGERVADIGAGAGAGTVVAADRGASVVAIEPTPYMRRVLGLRRLGRRGRSRIEVVDGAAEATGLDDRSVDGVWAVNSMHHWTDAEAAVRELARILAPGGRLVLADEDFDGPDHPDHERFHERHAHHQHHFDMIDPERIAEGLRAAGLDVTTAGRQRVAGRPTLLIEATAPHDATTSFESQITFLHVGDLGRAAAFYEGDLGLSLARDQGACRIYRVAARSYLGVCDHHPPEPGGVIVTMVADDVDGWAERLRSAGHEVDGPHDNARFAIRHCFVRDPDGHLVEIQRFDEPL